MHVVSRNARAYIPAYNNAQLVAKLYTSDLSGRRCPPTYSTFHSTDSFPSGEPMAAATPPRGLALALAAALERADALWRDPPALNRSPGAHPGAAARSEASPADRRSLWRDLDPLVFGLPCCSAPALAAAPVVVLRLAHEGLTSK